MCQTPSHAAAPPEAVAATTIGSERSSARQVTHGYFSTSTSRVPRRPVGSHADAAALFRSIGTTTSRRYWRRTKGSSAALSGRRPSLSCWWCCSSCRGFASMSSVSQTARPRPKSCVRSTGVRDALPLKSALRLVRLSPARYHAWKRAEKRCDLDDRSSCPRSHPTQLTPAEVSTIKEMVTASEYRHMPCPSSKPRRPHNR